jgi:hypothetical protein
MQLISEVNDVVPMIRICSSVAFGQQTTDFGHLDRQTSCRFPTHLFSFIFICFVIHQWVDLILIDCIGLGLEYEL